MSSTQPVFSIITPTYNRAYVLWKTISALQNQTLSNWEYIIIDDGSTDDTFKLIAQFQDDSRIKYIRQDNAGPAAARNRGLQTAQGDIIVYVDSDDIVYPNFLATIQHALQNDPDKTFGICNHNRFLEFLNPDYTARAIKFDPAQQKDTVLLQDFYDWSTKTTSTGVFHKRARFAGQAAWLGDIFIEDLDFIMQLAVLHEDGFLHIPQTLFTYKQTYGGDGLCSAASYATWAHSFKTIYERHKNDPLMKNPEVYLGRVKKYTDLHEKDLRGDVAPQVYKYFPELAPEKKDTGT